MSRVIRLGIAKNNNQKIQEVEKIQLLPGKGVVGDRHFHENNDARCQVTLIESENIDYYNNKFKIGMFLKGLLRPNSNPCPS